MPFVDTANEDIRRLVEEAEKRGIDTPHTRRLKAAQCKMGRGGACCNVCSEGPCILDEKHPYGVCGLNVHQVVAKNLLRHVTAGVACYVHVCENTARALLSMENVKSREKLKKVCDLLGIEDDHRRLAKLVLEDIYRPRWEESIIVTKLAFKPRLELFRKLNIVPGGAKSEIVDALVKTSTNLNANVIDLLFNVLRLGLVMGYVALRMNTWMNDIALGVPEPDTIETGIGKIDPSYVNILTTGHQTVIQQAVIEYASSSEAQELAKKAGAAGIRIVGATCVGQDIQSRWIYLKNSCFIGQCANNFGTEPLVASGLIDAVVSEFNCTFPGLTEISRHTGTKLIAADDVAYIEGAELVQWSPEKARDVAKRIVELAIEAFKARSRRIEKFGSVKKAVVGLSEDYIEKNLLDKLIQLIADGKIRGIAAVVGCSNLISRGHDVLTRDLTIELLKRGIMVWTAGCTSYGLQGLGFMSEEALEYASKDLQDACRELRLPPVWDFGLCMSISRIVYIAEKIAEKLNVDLPDLPVVVSAPQWFEEQALGDAAYALACGFLLHVYPSPFIDGSNMVKNILTEKLVELTGGRLYIEDDPVKAAEVLKSHIDSRRGKLGLKV
ncbi:MAG: anaerobic carbon-monoxide dehydrogenase catalytic subunit [Crenarchaeota archaeon]|nr:anaerobic carbon-monoxide dehydrogenase catalytic subunit [Thermoproteota archaeon]